MARDRRSEEREGYGTDSPPGDVQAPPQHPRLSHDYQFALEIQRSIGELSAKVDRVIKDQAEHGEKLDEIRHQVSFVRGIFYFAAVLAAIVAFMVSNKIHVSFGDPPVPEVTPQIRSAP